MNKEELEKVQDNIAGIGKDSSETLLSLQKLVHIEVSDKPKEEADQILKNLQKKFWQTTGQIPLTRGSFTLKGYNFHFTPNKKYIDVVITNQGDWQSLSRLTKANESHIKPVSSYTTRLSYDELKSITKFFTRTLEVFEDFQAADEDEKNA